MMMAGEKLQFLQIILQVIPFVMYLTLNNGGKYFRERGSKTCDKTCKVVIGFTQNLINDTI